MSIFVQQPRRRRGLSGLGAFAALLPAVRERGAAALVDGEWACDYDVIYAAVYNELSQIPTYRRAGTDVLARDAAAHAHAIWMNRCPQASIAQASVSIYNQGGGADYYGHPRGRHHRSTPTAAPGSGSAPYHSPSRYATQAQSSMPMRSDRHYSPTQHASSSAPMRASVHPSMSTSHLKGLGDVDSSTIMNLQRQIQAGRAGAPSTVTAARAASTSASVASRVADTVAPLIAAGQSQSTSSPMAMPSLSIEGALPTAIAAIMGLAIGLTVVSVFVPSK